MKGLRWLLGSLVLRIGARGERRSRASRGMAQGLVVALITLCFLSGTGLVRGWGNHTLDLWFSLRDMVPHDEGVSPRVAILAIDAPTRQAWHGRTFDARDVGRALLLLKQNGVVAVAVALPDAGRDFLSPGDKAVWRHDVAASGIAHLPSQSESMQNSASDSVANTSNESSQSQWYRDAAWRGHTAFLTDSDAHVRRVPLMLESGSVLNPALALSTALQGLQMQPEQIVLQNERGQVVPWNRARRMVLGDRSIALEPGGAMLLNFWASDDAFGDTTDTANGASFNSAIVSPTLDSRTGKLLLTPPAPQENFAVPVSSTETAMAPSFTTLSMVNVLRRPSLLRSWRGRCVVIGVTDAQAAPQWTLAGGARVPEAAIHAIVLDNLLSGGALDSVSVMQLWLLTVFLCMTVGGLVAARPPLWSGLVTSLALLAVALLSLGLFMQSEWLDVSLPCLAAALTFLQGVVSRARLQERETTRVSSTVEALERAGEIIAARGQSRELLERVLQWTLAAMGAEAALALVMENDVNLEKELSQLLGDDENEASEPRFRVLASVQRKPRSLDVLPLVARDEIAARVTLQEQPMLIQDAHRDPRFRYGRSYYTHFRSLSAPGALNITSVIAAPLREGDPTADDPQSGVRTVGAILVVNRRDGTPFHARDLELLTAVTNQASVALDNARLYEILNQRVARSESDLERTNRRLEAEKNTLQTVLESMTDGVVVTNNEGLVQILNPAARHLLPELDDNVVGQPLARCLPDVALALAARMMRPDVVAPNVSAPNVSAPNVSAPNVSAPNVSTTSSTTEETTISPISVTSNGTQPNQTNEDHQALKNAEATFIVEMAETESSDATSSKETFDETNASDHAEPLKRFSEVPLLELPLSDAPLLLPLVSTTQLQRGDVDAPRIIEVRSAPLLSADSKDSGIVWVFSDVTEEKSIEQAKSDFVSFVAHEMRSPLTSISGFSLMLQRMEKPDDESSTRKDAPLARLSAMMPNSAARDKNEKDKKEKSAATRQRFLGVIHNESERLTRLINNLLDVARLEAGRDLALQPESLDFAAVANEAIESQRVYSSRHTLVNAVPDGLPPLWADRDKVLQVLINLLSNAMKYSPGGNVTVAAQVEGTMLVASVSDEGPGIAPVHRERLFERFGRIGARDLPAKNPGSGERAKPTGTGLGLFLTRHLVESHGGRIWLDRETEQGARFCFSLPLQRTKTTLIEMPIVEETSVEETSVEMTSSDQSSTRNEKISTIETSASAISELA